MWTDWQGTSPENARANIAALQAAKITGSAVVLVLADVRTEFTPPKEQISNLIKELQRYVWEIEENGWDYNAAINPDKRRVTTTRPIFV